MKTRIRKKRMAQKQATGRKDKYPEFSVPRPDWLTEDIVPTIPRFAGASSTSEDMDSVKNWTKLDERFSQWLYDSVGIANLYGFRIVNITNNRVYFRGRFGLWWGGFSKFRKFGGRVYKAHSVQNDSLDLLLFELYGVLVKSRDADRLYECFTDEFYKKTLEERTSIVNSLIEEKNIKSIELPPEYEEAHQKIKLQMGSWK